MAKIWSSVSACRIIDNVCDRNFCQTIQISRTKMSATMTSKETKLRHENVTEATADKVSIIIHQECMCIQFTQTSQHSIICIEYFSDTKTTARNVSKTKTTHTLLSLTSVAFSTPQAALLADADDCRHVNIQSHY